MIVVATILALTGALAAFFIWKPLVRRVVLRNIARRPRDVIGPHPGTGSFP